MNWLDKLERKYGRYCIPQLMLYVVAAQAVLWVYIMLINQNLYPLLPLTRSALMQGQLWRLITFIVEPPLVRPLGAVLTFYFYWFLGTTLEREWGSFRFNVYFFTGVVGAILGCLLTGSAGTHGLFLSLFFAFAWMYPEMQVLLFFIIPIKVKWVGWFFLAMWVLDFMVASLSGKVSLLLGLAGFLLFFGRELVDWCKGSYTGYKRRKQWENQWKKR